MTRPNDRAADALRPLKIDIDVLKFAEGSALIEMGDTRVLAAASIESRLPVWRRDSGAGWLTAEYAMLPRATTTRSRRERSGVGGRTAEIQRLIGRSLRMAVDLTAMPDLTLTLDCDVLQADGGTRTASITGAYVAAVLALSRAHLRGDLARWPMVRQVAAVSVGVVGGQPVLDLEYVEDQAADVDMNVVATADGELVEIQATAESAPMSRAAMDELVDLAFAGIGRLVNAQDEVLAPALAEVEAVGREGRRPKTEPKDEAELWGRP